ncbi:MAG TPA: penicillin acylase family protein [Chitinophagaceae bacterium]|nr:penicillin acylase family protein [Chitinophagaceae bacterium]
MQTVTKAIFLCLLPLQALAQFSKGDVQRCETEAKQVTIIRDNWGIPHIYGKTDADAVFGLLYAQCEDDFNRVEMNYIEKLGRLAEVNGEHDLYNDLLNKMVLDSADAVNDYNNAPVWLKKLCNAFADGINYYLYKHPAIKPALLTHFKPWYPLLWTDGSIGAISTADLSDADLRNLYGGSNQPVAVKEKDYTDENLTGSNGFAFSPSVTADHNAILYINPHVTLYFRPEVHMVSGEGLNAYGAVTWGQFFVYQGFNEHCGWMHTSSYVDVSDAYIEKISQQNGKWVYEYEQRQKPVTVKTYTLHYKQGGSLQTKVVHALFTQHGPVMGKRNGQWLSVKSYNRSMNGLEQSWLRTKATSFAGFKKVLDLRGNTSNNTVYADAEGNIAYWHGDFVPVRDTGYNWAKPVDGTIAATDWKGIYDVKDIIHIENPKNGWLQNCNSTPFTVAGIYSPKKQDYPAYMAPDGENFRGINAVKVLSSQTGYTIDKVIAAGYNTHLAFFDGMVPALLKAYDSLPQNDSLRFALYQPVQVLRRWDMNSGENSVATTLAIEWATKLIPKIMRNPSNDEEDDQVTKTLRFEQEATPKDLLPPLLQTVKELTAKWGRWQIPWGQVNRFQRLNDDINIKYDDSKPSLPVGFASSLWGQIPSYSTRYFPGTMKRYGVNGNSFICAVEFGKRIKAKSLLAGGESGDINNPHFTDQALMYTKGQFKDVLFYKEDVEKHAERTYHPGE